MSRETELKDDFSSILLKWEKALTATESDLSRDAAILRFELAFEVGWKLIKKNGPEGRIRCKKSQASI